MPNNYGLEGLIQRAHAKFEEAKAAHAAHAVPATEKMMQRAFNRCDNLIKAYQNPDEPTRLCMSCKQVRHLRFDFVRRDGVRSVTCKVCEARLYGQNYQAKKREGGRVDISLSTTGRGFSKVTRALLEKAARSDMSAATGNMKWRLAKVKEKIAYYQMSGKSAMGNGRGQLKRLFATQEKLQRTLAALGVAHREQLNAISRGETPPDLATIARSELMMINA